MKKYKIITSSVMTSMMVIASASPALAYTKDETVYTKLNTDGQEVVTIVSEHLKNDQDEKTLEDISTLMNIFNVNGDETFRQDGQKLIWDAKGNDIYYQGKTNKTLPISMKITYKLDGKETTVDDMLGKAGNVEVCIKYTNHIRKNHLYVPFVVTTGMMLPTDQNSHVEVTNGKVVSNGSSHMIVALASPGLKEDYDDSNRLDGLDEVNIKYQTKSFELKSIVSVATPALLSDEDMKIFDKMDDMDALMDELMSSYSQLQQGGKDLNQGMNEFATQYSLFNQGIHDFNNGIKSAVTGADEVTNGLNVISHGLTELDSHSQELRNGASLTFNMLLSTATSQLKPQLNVVGLKIPDLTITNYNQILNEVLEKIAGSASLQVTQEVKKQVTQQVIVAVEKQVEENIEAGLKQQDENIRNQVKAGIIQKLLSQGYTNDQAQYYLTTLEGQKLFETQYQATLSSLKQQKMDDYKKSQEYQEIIANQVQATMNSQDIQNKIQQLIHQNTTGDEKTAYMQVYNLQIQLDTFKTFYQGIFDYTTNVGKLKDGTQQVLFGSKQLTQGLYQIQSGANYLADSSVQLNDAAYMLKKGTSELSSGLIEFNEKGLLPIQDIEKNVLKKNVNKTKELIALANDYKTFTEVNDGVEASTKFIMIVNSKSH